MMHGGGPRTTLAEPRRRQPVVESSLHNQEDVMDGAIHAQAGVDPAKLRSIERIYHLWDEALGRKDAEAAAKLYAPDIVLESPLVRHILKSERGTVEGHAALLDFLHAVFERTPRERHRYRTGFFTDGSKLIWEYPRATPDGDQMDFVESMEIEDGLIRRHCVYWGWYGVKLIEEDRYWR
jgi:hypothetical protein